MSKNIIDVKRNIRPLQEAMEILKPYYDEIVEDINGGVQDYLSIREFVNGLGVFVEYENRTKANLIHDHIKARITKRHGQQAIINGPSSKQETEAKKWNGIFALRIGEGLFIRFKKLNDSMRAAGLATKQHVKYMHQALISGFPDEPTFLFAGYVPNKSWTAIKGIYLACWNGESLEWFDEMGRYHIEQLNIFSTPSASPEPKKQSLVQRRKKDQNGIDKPDANTGTND